MAMVFCRGCAKEIHETAPSCPQCGAPQYLPATSQPASQPSPWMGITSLILGILCGLSLFDDSDWDRDTLLGLGLFALTGLVLGTLSIVNKKPGSNMAIAGAALSGISLFVYIGLSVN
ncbi:hypothetical protein D3C76_741290 [compost metagenome]|jgi:hypothetical protein|uniref:DUF4190 domain-containing protein n=1 Tax=Pseudomonas wadenswilerensis TaxID=1785161 RepID=A0A380T7A0_9PSED|nr:MULTISPECIES: zinc ribbon domain-containing protein [Pseudomonas]MCE5983148.1 zinc ribbon domain-containing protein [Pseudomonas sp. LF19]UVM22124.1 zinc ribbon domain-containing protein [Pseudomonas wadenswilerensis]SPO64361.1 conserved membrane protein of unknown function [Pseudomonas sp. JV241A]SUQ65883.1 hypothetical protein CCOS864_05361 [Pseudomonas wadenswilerensis]